jgi:hypothetical protein
MKLINLYAFTYINSHMLGLYVFAYKFISR